MRAFPKNLNLLAPVAQSVGHTLVQVPDAALPNTILLCNEVALPEFFTAASAPPPGRGLSSDRVDAAPQVS